MKLKPLIIAMSFTVISSLIYAEELASFECTDDEVEAFMKKSYEDKKVKQANFFEVKKAHQEVMKAQSEAKGEPECQTIFDTYEFPGLPQDMFDFDAERIPNLMTAAAEALAAAIDSGVCRTLSGDYFEGALDNRFEYNKALREEGITKKHDPWLPQIMKDQLRTEYGRELGDVLNFSDPNQVKNFESFFGDSLEENVLDPMFDGLFGIE